MEFAEPPRAFKGFPIILIAAGLLAMAFAGFAGIKL
jgi:electron transport complex protein RnfA